MNKNTYTLAKLVRDKSIHNMEEKGVEVKWHTLSTTQKLEHYIKKLEEETLEVKQALAENDAKEVCEELADLQELICAIAESMDIPMADVEASRQGKIDRRGGFSKGIFIETVACSEGSFYDTYCAKDPAKYQPVK